MPPTPMKCTRLTCPEYTHEFSTSLQPDQFIHDVFRRARPGELSSRGRHPAPALAIARERDHPVRDPLSCQITLVHHLGGTGRLQRPRVVALVIVGRGRQRNENRRTAGSRHFRERRRAGPRDDEPCGFHLSVHRIDEPFHAALHAVPLERRLEPCRSRVSPSGRRDRGSRLRQPASVPPPPWPC